MSHGIVVALNVTDATRYQQYREAMAPVLAAHGGGFRYAVDGVTLLGAYDR